MEYKCGSPSDPSAAEEMEVAVSKARAKVVSAWRAELPVCELASPTRVALSPLVSMPSVRGPGPAMTAL